MASGVTLDLSTCGSSQQDLPLKYSMHSNQSGGGRDRDSGRGERGSENRERESSARTERDTKERTEREPRERQHVDVFHPKVGCLTPTWSAVGIVARCLYIFSLRICQAKYELGNTMGDASLSVSFFQLFSLAFRQAARSTWAVSNHESRMIV